MTEILMPALSDSMEQGLLLQWLVADGAEIKVGDELCEIETDKATMTYESEVDGVIQIIAPEGTTVAVGDPIATIGSEAPAMTPATSEPVPVEQAPDEQPAGEEAPDEPAGEEAPDEPAGEQAPDEGAPGERAPEPVAVSGNGHVASSTVIATPVARRLAAVHGVAIDGLTGTGPRGRITKADVMGAAGIEAPPSAPPAAPAARKSAADPAAPADPADPAAPKPAAAPAAASSRTEELTRLQQVVARRMAEAKSTIPHFQVQTEVAFDAAIALRTELKDAAGDTPVPSLNDLIVKASALALRAHPHANGSYKDGRFELHDRVNVGVAVAADSALVVPTVFDADIKALGAIAANTRALAAKVRDGAITPPELSGATFTVSNLGMFGMTAITPVINPPQAAILGVGAARATLARAADTGEIVEAQLLTLTLSCDHRILYGADAARFLADIKALLESPLRLAFG